MGPRAGQRHVPSAPSVPCCLWARHGLRGPGASMARHSRDRQGGKSPPRLTAGGQLWLRPRLCCQPGASARPEPRPGRPALPGRCSHLPLLGAVVRPGCVVRSVNKQLTVLVSFGAPCRFLTSTVPRWPDEKVKTFVGEEQ